MKPHRHRILCIDDDPAISAAIKVKLRRFALDVSSAFFGEQGVWLAITQVPDLIITDLHMPHGDGAFVVQCLRERHDTCNIPIVVLTGRRSADLKQKMMTLGVARYMHKPLPMEQIENSIKEHLALHPE